MYDSIMHQFGLSQQGYYLEACFDHVPVLQEDELQKANTQKVKAETLKSIIEMGVIVNEEEIRSLLNI
jgi:hypothetical protein